MTRLLAVLWLALLALATPAAAQTFPELTGRVVDQANLLSTTQELELAAKSEQLEKQTGRQFVVATVGSLEGLEIEDYGTRLGRHWKIGDEKRDDGVILLVAPNEKKVRIETGYGAEGFLPDILAGWIIRDDILPRFRSGDMSGGILAGADRIIQQLSLPPEEARQRAEQIQQQEASRPKRGFNPMPMIFWGMVALFVLMSMARGGGGRRYRSGGRRRHRGGIDPWIVLWGLSELNRASRGRGGWGGGGGGFGGFGGGGGGFGGFSGGGGSFGGGGASGGW